MSIGWYGAEDSLITADECKRRVGQSEETRGEAYIEAGDTTPTTTTKPDPGKTSTEKNAEWSQSPPTLTGISPHLKQSIKDWPENLPEKKNTGGSK